MTFTKGHKHGVRFKKGTTPWNKGKTGVYTNETRTALSLAQRGRKYNIEVRKRLSLMRKGEMHWNWRGGITPLNKAIRRSKEYMDWRNAVYKRDDYTCQDCGARGVKLHADHIKQFALFPELRFEKSNGRTLCVPCHKKTPTFGSRLTGGDTDTLWEEILPTNHIT